MSRRATVLAPLFIAVYFLAFAKDALLSYFDPDACMNLYRSWAHPAGALVRANLLFFLNSPFYRPMGSVWYRTIYELFGFTPAPFAVATLLLVAANTWLTYLVCRHLTDSAEPALLAALLIAYHGRFLPLYFDLGFIYDVLCYFFYFFVVWFYLRVRSRNRLFRAWELAVFLAIYICALNSKEIAVTLPLFLVFYEWLYHRHALSTWRDLLRWPIATGRAILAAALLTALFAIGRASGSESLLTNPEYQPVFSWQRLMETSGNFVAAIFFFSRSFGSATVLLIWVLLFALAWISRSRALKFAWLFLMFSPLPVAFIVPRGAAQYYVPLFGWALYTAVGLVLGTQLVFRKLALKKIFSPLITAERPLWVFLSCAAFMIWLNHRSSWSEVTTVSCEGAVFESVVEQVHQLRPVLRRGARLLFLDDPFEEPFALFYLMQLSYHDGTLVVDRAKSMERSPSAEQLAGYDVTLDYRLGRIFSPPAPRPAGPEPSIVFECGRPAAFHTDWTQVTRAHPARRGETLISMVTDLGATEPPVPPDHPFPDQPLVKVITPVEVLVDGQRADVLTTIGWPKEVNRYRVDFRIPKNARSGNRAVLIQCGKVTSLAASIAIK